MMCPMTRHVTAATLVVLSAIVLSSCAAPAEPDDDPVERTAIALELLVANKYGDDYVDMLGDEWFEGVATDLVENCDTPGFRDGYIASFKDQPDMGAMIDEVWDTACSSS